MRTLLIIDPQIDFISGSLAVNHATEAMDYLVSWLEEHSSTLDQIVLTMDQHPADHCSFVSQGGRWPGHCVRYTIGAAIYPPLQELFSSLDIPILYIEKGRLSTEEEYSAFGKEIPEVLTNSDLIYTAGIAGDYCVAESLKDLQQVIPKDRFYLLENAIPYINPPINDN